MSRNNRDEHDLRVIAHQAMLERGFAPDFEPTVLREVEKLQPVADGDGAPIRDLTGLLWFSIDNDDSRDLDQLSYAERIDGDRVKLMVAVADVDSLVKKGSAIDAHAEKNTTSVYTSGGTFTMLPEPLCFDLTSLNQDVERLAVVVQMEVDAGGRVQGGDVYRARVINKAKLTYHGVGAWLEGSGPVPEKVEGIAALADQIRLQDETAQNLKELRYEHGALQLQTIEARPVFDGKNIVDLVADPSNRAKELIENLMVAANGVTARFLAARRFPVLRRIVKEPERWEKIVAVAAEYGETLPPGPDCKALSEFLEKRKKADPLRFPDLSLVIVKLMGPGEYAVETPGRPVPGHFGLAVKDYAHSTAPNRRYPDLITQRLLKATLASAPVPYSTGELDGLAQHCTQKEDDANKVERRLRKSAAALLLSNRIGDHFDAIVSGASEKGVWVRLFHPPIEGKVVHGGKGLDVGDRVRVKLIETDVSAGFIDFVKTGR